MSTGTTRLAFIDALKAIASQLIVLHHLAFYGPMSDYAQPLAATLISWLSQHARIAVQAFLVIGGFLAARTLAREGRLVASSVPALLWRRYLKLALPYFGALLLAILGAALARTLMTNASIPAAPTLPQLLAHLVLLQSILGFDGLSAGVWYVAIDFQLYAMLLAMLWLARRAGGHAPEVGRLLVVALMLASLFYFNRDAGWDNWGLYFFGAYGLGAITYWTGCRPRALGWLALIVALVMIALLVDYRSRIAVALLVAIALGVGRSRGFMESWPQSPLIAWLGKISYSVFLVHFPICLVINALFEQWVPHTPSLQLTGMIMAWLISVAGGALFHRQVECRTLAPRLGSAQR